MRSSSSGFLLLLVGAVALIGYLTGNLDRWLGYLFAGGTAPVVSTAPTSSSSGVATSSGPNRRGGNA